MQILKNILIVITTSLFCNYFATTVNAAGQYGCPTQYGGECPSQEILINKTVKDPKTGSFVEIIGNNDNKFSPNQNVTFKITVRNTGKDTIERVLVQDIFPEFITFEKGPGKFDSNTKTLSIEIKNLMPNQMREYIIEGKIAPENKLPADQGIICVVNQAQAKLNGKISTDNTQLCIEKKVLGENKGGLKIFPQTQAITTPTTGPEILALIGLLPGAMTGLILRKKAKKNN
jgi:uncharacterized repeat protein (TIGR01451 family)